MNRLDPLTLPLHGRRLIEASAGTGKTYAITSIVLRLLLGHDGTATGVNPRRIEQILIVTFTRAATEELRGRIRARLREARLAFEEDAGISEDEFIAQLRLASSDRVVDHRRLALAEMDLDLASIFTIHGFASRMLQRNAFESGASFAADISEDDRRVVEEALRDVWRERVYPLAALPASTVLDESSAREFIDRARQLLGKQGLRFDNLPAASWSELLQELADGEYTLLDWWRAHGSSVRGVMGSTKLNKSGKEAFCASLAALEAGEPTALDRMIVSGLSQSFLESQLNKAAKGNSLPDLDLFRLADRVLDTGRQLSARLLFDALELARTRLAELKERTGLLGYEDLLRLLEKGLAAPGGGERLAAAIREQYPVALIDECQDTDPLQWCVFERIYDAPGTGLFLVGDPKQAIYAFRGADVYAYLRVRREAGESYTLDTNYRSVEPLIRSLNALFGLRKDKDPFRGKGDMPYVEVRPSHRPDAKPLTRDGEPLAPLQLLAHLDDRPIGTGDYRARMARLAAGHMAGLLADVSVRIGERRLEAGDIACLVRGWPDALALASELQRYAIPYVYRGRDSVFGSAAALDVHQLLAAVLDPGSERHLRAALGCALLGYGAAELDSLLGDERALLEVQQRFFVHARRLREHGVQAALRRLLFEHEVPARVLAQPDGERRLTNCLHLLELLQAERETLDSDEALLARLAERIANPDGEREEQQLRLESDARRVQIVTLHSSKGLEYPVVYLPFPAHYRKADEPLWHDRESLHLRYDLEGNEDSLARADEERLAEDMRLLYVGLTRAVHCCVLGVADIVHGSSKKSDLERTAFGYLLGAQEGEARAALERLIALPGAVLFDPEAALPLACTEKEEPEELAAREFTAAIERDWSATSYSALVRTVSERAERAFRQPELGGVERSRRDGGDRGIFGFERGAEAGSFLHGLLERVDFSQPAAAPANAGLIATALARSAREAQWQPALEQMIDDVLGCTLDGESLRLADLSAAQRIVEMGFELPLAPLAASELNRLLLQHEPLAARGAALGFATIRGMLSGFIDLVFEYRGRYFVADFKSNHLGASVEDYAPPMLEASIAEHRYDLQYVLYSVALQRFLRARLGAAYDPDLHLGGVYYLYLRGMRRAAGAAYGVFHTRPAQALIDALDALFAGRST
ncbi:MAG: exodeoxyribonuclease V subunit beta [Gammaproteobacteria bacterium]|jgi:exodeoxyribonuclease V beta subunit|nr:exodeoxyribonuclease V subunit beta [Gammaproteobacteria bacterium]MBP6052539.1 exodeoxyribonuclease V subunit beta [Pseudomonadales bacterium]MBK6583098.1 exodeoxyribonuclease V subunit beta [Gammaproteobacteria bacterium]MBK7519227.1 exodeoxyribonuclease V subunit beta [Gammaproteobacteria bacterium]MBK7730033.1 exodeoxyribonuclease V subunit beta [Gammaproteobacteria bacterium]